jgi:hypothetical protein
MELQKQIERRGRVEKFMKETLTDSIWHIVVNVRLLPKLLPRPNPNVISHAKPLM